MTKNGLGTRGRRRRRTTRVVALLGLLLLAPAGCRSFDDARVLQALNQRGFGRKYVGDSNEILTIGIGDTVTVRDPNNPDILLTQSVRMDGVISDPLIGEVFVAGFTTDEIAQALNQRYAEFYKDVDVYVEPGAITSKRYWIRGETLLEGQQPFEGNTTVWDAIMRGGVPNTADLDDIYVIRADPQHPLIIPVNLEKMLEHGDSSDNILIREDDIIVVNPNLAGIVKNAVEVILAPIQPVLQLAISVRNIQTIYDSFVEDDNFFVGNLGTNAFGGGFGGYGGYGGYGGGFNTFQQQSNAVVTPPGGSAAKPAPVVPPTSGN